MHFKVLIKAHEGEQGAPLSADRLRSLLERCLAPLRDEAQVDIRELSDARVPESNGAVPYLVVRGAPDAIAFYQRVFGAELLFRLDDPAGAVMHAELQVGPARFMLTEEQPERDSLGPQTIGGSGSFAVVYVPEVDAVVEQAVKAGAKVTMPVQDQFWGDRAGGIVDPFGHRWLVATHVEDPSPQEIQRRVQQLFAAGGQG